MITGIEIDLGYLLKS